MLDTGAYIPVVPRGGRGKGITEFGTSLIYIYWRLHSETLSQEEKKRL